MPDAANLPPFRLLPQKKPDIECIRKADGTIYLKQRHAPGERPRPGKTRAPPRTAPRQENERRAALARANRAQRASERARARETRTRAADGRGLGTGCCKSINHAKRTRPSRGAKSARKTFFGGGANARVSQPPNSPPPPHLRPPSPPAPLSFQPIQPCFRATSITSLAASESNALCRLFREVMFPSGFFNVRGNRNL